MTDFFFLNYYTSTYYDTIKTDRQLVLMNFSTTRYYFTYFISIMSIIFNDINYSYYINYDTIMSLIFNQIYYITIFLTLFHSD